MPKLKPGTLIPTAEEEMAITAAAMDDPDARPFTDEDWADVSRYEAVDAPYKQS